MSDSYDLWLDAAIQHIQLLKEQGQSWIALRPETIKWLAHARRPALVASSARQSAPAPNHAEPFVESPPVPTAQAPFHAVPSQPTPARDAVLPSHGKAAALAELRTRTLGCQQCGHLAASRKNVVFGVGDPNSPLMFVGEAPGANEDIQGEPFVGAAGQLLTRIIKAMGLSRETVYIANVLKCRPDTPGQAYGNRKPTAAEMKTCLPYLLEQIKIIQPQVIVALGATAMEGLFGRVLSISRARGHWHTFEQTPVMPTYHPSYLLHNQAPAVVKREVWEDMLQVMERLGLPISVKQRNYFK